MVMASWWENEHTRSELKIIKCFELLSFKDYKNWFTFTRKSSSVATHTLHFCSANQHHLVYVQPQYQQGMQLQRHI